MILFDISSTLHRMIFGSTRDASKIRMQNNKYITEDFIFLALHYILSELIDVKNKYGSYGEVVLCFDDYKKAYWRRDAYSEYKGNRRANKDIIINPEYKLNFKFSRDKDESPINYQEVFEYTNKLFEQIQNNTPWKCIYVNRAEADDIILVLAKEYYQEGILILSPDKDFIQSQRFPNVVQYSSLTKQWITPDTKHGDMTNWIRQHVMLGDGADGVPKVTDNTEFSKEFIKHIKSFDKDYPIDVKTFKSLSLEEKREILRPYDVKTYNKKGQETGFDIYNNCNFGVSNIEKILNGTWSKQRYSDKIQNEIKYLKGSMPVDTIQREQMKELKIQLKADKKNTDIKASIKAINSIIKDIKEKRTKIRDKIKVLQQKIKDYNDTKTEQERLDEFLDSHPLYREHYDRNYILVMEEGIPDYIRANILMEYKSCYTDYNEDNFFKYLDENKLGTIKAKIPLVFKSTETLNISNCGWDL